jgi:hypothetical protein
MRTAACAFIVVTPAICGAQEGPASPITAATRTEWVAKSVVGPQSLVAGVFVAGFGTAIDLPPEWRRSTDGFALRYASRDAAVLTSNGLEAALGSMWGEDPRYFKCQCNGLSHRIGNAAKLAVFAQRSDGRIGPAWGRYAGTMTSSVVQNAWLPASASTWQQTLIREATAFSGRFVGNLWSEFWPDVERHIRH